MFNTKISTRYYKPQALVGMLTALGITKSRKTKFGFRVSSTPIAPQLTTGVIHTYELILSSNE
ncbi:MULTISPECIES: hypothetical protein [Fischerella]|uniref:hypothetical protein n=1 Tax=Fischerella TaxID=1190 RepID=UPI0011AF7A54|nr:MULTISPECIES: hypothetical protein [Fischerella]